MRTGDFGLPPGCSATYDVELVDVLRAVTRVGARSALEDYCRSYADERGHRPSAVQAYEAGYNPSSVRARHGHWFAFLDDVDLLAEQEREVVRRHADVLATIEKEPITKSYKLVTLQALLQIDALRTAQTSPRSPGPRTGSSPATHACWQTPARRRCPTRQR